MTDGRPPASELFLMTFRFYEHGCGRGARACRCCQTQAAHGSDLADQNWRFERARLGFCQSRQCGKSARIAVIQITCSAVARQFRVSFASDSLFFFFFFAFFLFLLWRLRGERARGLCAPWPVLVTRTWYTSPPSFLNDSVRKPGVALHKEMANEGQGGRGAGGGGGRRRGGRRRRRRSEQRATNDTGSSGRRTSA